MSKQDSQSSLELFAWTASELPIRFLGDELLKTVCRPVGKQEFETEGVQKIADELVTVLTKYRNHIIQDTSQVMHCITKSTPPVVKVRLLAKIQNNLIR